MTTPLLVARHKATDAKKRIGSLFVNPGGPGQSGVQSLQRFVDSLGPEVTARYDIVAMDPRGVEGSAGARCTPTKKLLHDSAPLHAGETAERLVVDAEQREACRSRSCQRARAC